MLCQLVNLMLCNHNGIFVIEAGKICMFEGIILLINLIKNLPCNIKFNLLLQLLQLVVVLVLEIGVLGKLQGVVFIIKFFIKASLTFFHELIEDAIILFPNLLMHLLVLKCYTKLRTWLWFLRL